MAKAMTKGQIEHLAARIDGEIGKAVAAFEAKLPEVDMARITFKQKVDLIRSGKAVMLPNEKLCSSTDLDDAYTYPTWDKASATNEKLHAKREADIEKFKKPLLAKRQAIMDNAILGGADEALAALQDFVAQLNK